MRLKLLQRYITRDLVWTTLLALFLLVALFSFFTLVDQLEDTGRGKYGVLQACVYVILSIPSMIYDLFPIAAVIGSMTVLGLLARNNELDVIYTSGVSKLRLAAVLIRSSLLILLLAIVIGEMLAPFSEEKAQNLRSLSMSEQISLKTRYGFWIRDGNSYVNIRKVLPGNRIEQIYVYQFGHDGKLHSSMQAESAVYEGGKWLMQNITESVIKDEKIVNRTLPQAAWDSLLSPDIINVVIVEPRFLTVAGLLNYISYLQQNSQDSRLYEQVLWSKLIKPFSILGMILLAIPLVKGNGRSVALGQRVFTGALAGILFHLCNQVSVNLGVVYQIQPAISVVAPTLLLYLLILSLMRN